jgi:UDP-2,3-diacylglucosamine pyrophosphatase LpxH
MRSGGKRANLRSIRRGAEMNRRAFFKAGTLWLLASRIGGRCLRAADALNDPGAPLLRMGLLTDLHYADRPPAGTRFYRETLVKLRECVRKLNAMGPEFVIELGDFIDAADTADVEIGYLKTVEAEFARLQSPRHYVLGNHCVWTLNKEQFFSNCAAQKPFYSFDAHGVHVVVLDACYRADGVPYGARNFDWTDTEIPPAEREWLREDLKAAKGRAVIFVHQRLDVQTDYGVKSALAVRQILENSGKVLAVVQGHYHHNDYRHINGIHYCTLAAMIEGTGPEHNAFALMSVFKDGLIKLDGFGDQKSYQFGEERKLTDH